MQFVVLALLVACVFALPIKRSTHDHDEDEMMGLAWHAAAGEVNEGRSGKYLVPTRIISSNTVGDVITIEAIFQESWCSTDEGNNLEDVCEEMCPIYLGSPEHKFRLTIVTSDGEDEQVTVENL